MSEVCGLIQKGLFDLGVSSVPTLDKPDDPVFATWTEFVADAMFQTYPPGQQHPTKLGRYPNADDVAGAYGAYRLLLSLQTEDEVEPPRIPDIAGDLEHDPRRSVEEGQRRPRSRPAATGPVEQPKLQP